MTTQQYETTASWMLPETFTIRLVMHSDWHVGSGTGRPGNVDRLVARDTDELPYVPAKTLTGIWRDALERLTFALDNGEHDGAWSQWVDVLFGSQPAIAQGVQIVPPRPAALAIKPARLHQTLRNRLKGDAKAPLRNALTFVKPGVAIDAASGQARPGFLRFEEMARVGTTLYAECTLKLPGNADQTAASALLLTSAKLVERLGGKRRRGAGRCTMRVVNRNDIYALQWLRDHAEPPSPPKPPGPGIATLILRTTQQATGGSWLRVPMTLTLETPVSVAARTLGNVTETLDYIPGTFLLPHLTHALRAIGYDCRSAVASGALQMLPATIDVHGSRGRPVPHVLFRHKVGGSFEQRGTIVNRLMENADQSTQIKGFSEGYIGAYAPPVNDIGTLPFYLRVPQVLLTHNTVEDVTQRPTEDVGGVYSREAIAAGIVLHTELRVHSDIAEALAALDVRWWESFAGTLRLGVSRKDDYGVVRLVVQSEPQLIQEQPPLDPTNPRRLTVWLLSDVLLRNDTLRPSHTKPRLRQELETWLGVRLQESSHTDQYFNSLIRVHRLESWHTGWGLPRPSLVAMAGGSCAVFEVIDTPLELDQLREKMRVVEASGIGERRAEGHGQLCFNAPLLTYPLRVWRAAVKPGRSEPESMLQPLSETEESFAKRIERVAWREALHRTVLGLAADPSRRKTMLGIDVLREGDRAVSSPPMSQLGSFRSVLSGLHEQEGIEVARQWLLQLMANPNRRDKWPKEAHACLNELLTRPDSVWTSIGDAWEDPPVLSDTTANALRAELWLEAVQLLVDACIRAHKRDIEPTSDEPIIRQEGDDYGS